jgi:hypothetical protein
MQQSRKVREMDPTTRTVFYKVRNRQDHNRVRSKIVRKHVRSAALRDGLRRKELIFLYV